ncbi:MAG: hypothetical protein M3Q81_05580 [bacterium]|nr:hypothetical protein [bacterium]
MIPTETSYQDSLLESTQPHTLPPESLPEPRPLLYLEETLADTRPMAAVFTEEDRLGEKVEDLLAGDRPAEWPQMELDTKVEWLMERFPAFTDHLKETLKGMVGQPDYIEQAEEYLKNTWDITLESDDPVQRFFRLNAILGQMLPRTVVERITQVGLSECLHHQREIFHQPLTEVDILTLRQDHDVEYRRESIKPTGRFRQIFVGEEVTEQDTTPLVLEQAYQVFMDTLQSRVANEGVKAPDIELVLAEFQIYLENIQGYIAAKDSYSKLLNSFNAELKWSKNTSDQGSRALFLIQADQRRAQNELDRLAPPLKPAHLQALQSELAAFLNESTQLNQLSGGEPNIDRLLHQFSQLGQYHWRTSEVAQQVTRSTQRLKEFHKANKNTALDQDDNDVTPANEVVVV